MAAGGKIILKLSFQDVFILLVFLKLPNLLLHQNLFSGIFSMVNYLLFLAKYFFKKVVIRTIYYVYLFSTTCRFKYLINHKSLVFFYLFFFTLCTGYRRDYSSLTMICTMQQTFISTVYL